MAGGRYGKAERWEVKGEGGHRGFLTASGVCRRKTMNLRLRVDIEPDGFHQVRHECVLLKMHYVRQGGAIKASSKKKAGTKHSRPRICYNASRFEPTRAQTATAESKPAIRTTSTGHFNDRAPTLNQTPSLLRIIDPRSLDSSSIRLPQSRLRLLFRPTPALDLP